MGSPISPTSTIIYVKEFQQEVLASAEFKLNIGGDVDDTFIVFSHRDTKVNTFLNHVNGTTFISLTLDKVDNKISLFLCVR